MTGLGLAWMIQNKSAWMTKKSVLRHNGFKESTVRLEACCTAERRAIVFSFFSLAGGFPPVQNDLLLPNAFQPFVSPFAKY